MVLAFASSLLPLLRSGLEVDAVPVSAVALPLGSVLLSDAAGQRRPHHLPVKLLHHCAELHLYDGSNVWRDGYG